MDQTRGILTYVEQNCPGRFHSSIEYVTVAGKYIEGAGLRDKGASIAQKVVGAGYQQVHLCRMIALLDNPLCLLDGAAQVAACKLTTCHTLHLAA